MKTLTLLRGAAVALALPFLLPLSTSAATPTVQTFTRLGGTADGYHPQGALVGDGSGFYFGTTEAGGPANCGTVYRLAPDGTLTTLYAFTGGADGANPNGALVSDGDGYFYGTTAGGGANGTGTVFQMSSLGSLTSLHSFGAYDAQFHNADGAAPQAALVQGGDGYLFGTTTAGGASGNGTIFRILPDGTFNLAHVFSVYADGTTPKAALRVGVDKALYGTTSSGGTGFGTIFRVTTDGTTYQALYRFTGGADGGSPSTALVFSGNAFYGLTNKTFYSATAAGVLTTLHTFDPASEGAAPFGGLSEASDGNFYGAAAQQGPGGYGTVFQVTPGGAVTILHAFGNGADGAYPLTPPVAGRNGSLLGVASAGFNGNYVGGGTAYQVTTGGAFTTLHAFSEGGKFCNAGLAQGTDGNFYGTTSGGGAKGGGTVFVYNPDSVLLGLYDPDPDTEGRGPNAALLDGGNGSFYGTTAGGGPDGVGAVYQLTVTPRVVQAAVPHSGNQTGGYPRYQNPGIGDLAFGWITRTLPPDTGEDAKPATPRGITLRHPTPSPASQFRAQDAGTPEFYTVYQAGGNGNGGALYSFPGVGTPTPLHSFGLVGGDGLLPEGLVQSPDGNFYGTTYGGGTATRGTIFKYGADGSYSVLYSFQGTGDGAYPQAGLTPGSDGSLYGVTQHGSYSDQGGFQGSGTIFRITSNGAFATLHTFSSDGSEGQQPMAELVQASDGALYGTTSSGGKNFAGTVFSITPGGAFINVYSFDPYHGAGGGAPQAPLIQAADGNLYGTTTSGGTDGAGLIFRVTLGPAVITPPPDNLPALTLSTPIPSVTAGSGLFGEYLLTLSSPASTDLQVAYTVKGSAVNGTDYTLLKGTKKIKAGKTSKPLKVFPLGDLGGGGKKALKLTLAPGNGYTVGTPTFVKIKILPPEQ